MNTLTKTLAACGTAFLVAGVGIGVAQADDPAPRPGPAASAGAQIQLSEETKKALAFNREEERMARDLYQLFSDKYGKAVPFSRITVAEQRHADAVLTLLQRYGLPDPAAGKEAGKYADPELQKRYNDWSTRGTTSQAEANKVGVELEKQDIADLDKTLAGLPDSDVKTVLSRLRSASVQHEKAFQAAVDGKTLGMGRGPGASDSRGQGNGPRQGAGQGQGMGQRQGKGQGPRDGSGMGRTGQRPADCPLAP